MKVFKPPRPLVSAPWAHAPSHRPTKEHIIIDIDFTDDWVICLCGVETTTTTYAEHQKQVAS